MLRERPGRLSHHTTLRGMSPGTDSLSAESSATQPSPSSPSICRTLRTWASTIALIMIPVVLLKAGLPLLQVYMFFIILYD